MKARPFFLLLCLLLVLNLTACSGYNKIMYKHLSDENNYKTYEVTVKNIYVRNKESGRLEKYDEALHDESYLSATVFFGVSKLDGFDSGEYPLSDGTKTENIVLLEVCAENSKTLLEKGFYENFSPGKVIEVQCSDWIYMDGNFYYVIAVKDGETQYLNSKEGLQNIIDMMDKDRSFF